MVGPLPIRSLTVEAAGTAADFFFPRRANTARAKLCGRVWSVRHLRADIFGNRGSVILTPVDVAVGVRQVTDS